MAGVNKAIVVGFVGKDPEIRTTQAGTQVATFSVATSEAWKDKTTGERREVTDWHRVVVFNEALVKVEPHELAAAMGFDSADVAYEFAGTKTEQVKQIGNAVSVAMMKAEVKAIIGDAAIPASAPARRRVSA